MLKQYLKLTFFIGLFVFFVTIQFFEIKNLSLEEMLSYKSLLYNKVQNNYFLYYVFYFFLYTLIVALSIPIASILSFLAGTIFGFLNGLILVSFASSLGSLICFLIARHLIRKLLEQKFKRLFNKINKRFIKEGLYYLFFLRMVPVVPFFLINLLFGITKIKALHFYFISQISMLPGTILYVIAGSEVSKISNFEEVFNYKVIIILSLIGLFPYLIKKSFKFVKKKYNLV